MSKDLKIASILQMDGWTRHMGMYLKDYPGPANDWKFDTMGEAFEAFNKAKDDCKQVGGITFEPVGKQYKWSVRVGKTGLKRQTEEKKNETWSWAPNDI